MKQFKWKSKTERNDFRIPRSVQQSIPIKRIYKDGIFQLSGRFSKTWRFFDINYQVASPEQQMNLHEIYCAFLNALPIDAQVKISLCNRRINQKEFNQSLLLKPQGDGMDRLRAEYNDLLAEKAKDGNQLIQEKYITVSVEKKNIEEARTFFNRVGVDLSTGLARLDSSLREITVNERLQLFHDFFRSGQEAYFHFDMKRSQSLGHDFRDSIAPECLSFKKDYFELGEQVGRVLFLREYASFFKDKLITELTDYSRNMIVSIDILPEDLNKSVSRTQKTILAVESDIARWQSRQNANYNFSASIPYNMNQIRNDTKELLDDLTSRDQRMMLVVVTLVHLADTLEQLNQDTSAIEAIGRNNACQLATLKYQQEDGLNTVLPYGLRKIEALRSLTTESTAVLMPFKSQEVQDSGGIYYGVNAVSRNLIICNRANLLNGNGFILGVSGSGKSFAAKQEIATVALATEDDIIVVDPEREYGPLIESLGGETIVISGSSDSHINALDLSAEYGDGKNPLVLKSDFIMSLCEQLMGAELIGAKERSIIDRCVDNVYREYIKNNYEGNPPTLLDLYNDLQRQVEPAARDIALSLELFVKGTLNVFSHQSNINTSNRILCYDIQELGENLKPLGLLVMLDAILNRVIQNREKGRYTHVYIDEIYLFFSSGSVGSRSSINSYSSEFLYKCWKRFRKYGAMLTGITQNVEECLLSSTARMMFANSEFLLMFNQAATDRMELAKLLNISETQLSYITNAPAGHGLIKVGGGIVPFVNQFPQQTRLYQLMSTKLADRMEQETAEV